jgi:prepilin-type N-terminal cleavage/methylation domain-containing protein
MKKCRSHGFTLIEILISLALLAILVGSYFLVANPAGQLAVSRNNTRTLNLQTIMLGIQQNIADQGTETFSCSSGSIPTSTKTMGSAAGNYNIAPCLVPNDLALLPVDPSASSAYYTSVSNYDTDYTIVENASGSITLSAPNAELKQVITKTVTY